MREDDEDLNEFEEEEEEQDLFPYNTLVMIETADDYLFIGKLQSVSLPAIVIAQTHAEISQNSDLGKDFSVEAIQFETPIRVMIPYANILNMRRFDDIALENTLSSFKSEINEYNEPKSANPTEKQSIWLKFIEIVDRLLKKANI